MTAPPLSVLSPATADDEPLCADCIAHEGLCRKHASHVLPQLAEPSWVRMIGEPYVCTEARCEDHVKCADTGIPAPRAGCGCHHCSQRRWARARAAHQDESTVAGARAQRRNARKQRRAVERLAHAINGQFTRSTGPSRARSVA